MCMFLDSASRIVRRLSLDFMDLVMCRLMHAYAAVVYIQCVSGSEKKMVFWTSKSRVAPLGGITVPRLELLGALLLSRLISSVYEALKGELELQSSVCYTDLQVTLFWILGDNKEWKPFVEVE